MADVTEFFRSNQAIHPALASTAGQASEIGGMNFNSFLLIVNGLALMVIGLYLWRRQS